MSRYLFEEVNMKKKDFYSWLKEILESSGWENISSRPSTDHDLFYSTGEGGEDDLFFQMKEYQSSASGSSLSNSNERFFDIKLLKGYTPGEPGVAGVLNRSNEPFKRLQIAQGTVSLNSDMTVYYHVNKNRVIVMIEYPVGINQDSMLFMIGRPDEHLSKHYENGSMMYFSTISRDATAGAVDEADNIRNATYPLDTIELIPPRMKSTDGIAMLSELAVTSNSEGVKGLIDGVYVLSGDVHYNGNANRGDFFLDESGNVYKLFYLSTRTASSYDYYVPTRYMAIMVERGVVDV